MKTYVTLGVTVLAGAALFEAALIPGIVIGGAAVLAPRLLPSRQRRIANAGMRPRAPGKTSGQLSAVVSGGAASDPKAAPLLSALLPARFGLKRAIAKTITYRVIVTTLDFTTNYVVIGELAAAAGLSAFSLVVAPLFYLTHETAWNYYGPPGNAVDVPVGLGGRRKGADPGARFTISRALAKTITFRSIGTVMDFATNYVVVRDVATAAGLLAFGFVVGPFIYLGHEKVWDRFAPVDEPGRAADRAASASETL